MLKLQLSKDDFKMVTEKSEALKCKFTSTSKINIFLFFIIELNRALTEHRDLMIAG